MIVDIHTHHLVNKDEIAIRNLSIKEAETVFLSEKTGLFSVGFHPWFLNGCTEDSFAKLEELATDKRIVMIGECGLDKNSNFPIDMQIDIFKKQIELSEFVRKPLIIHCVSYFNELIEIKETKKVQQLWIIHGFRGKPELAHQLIKVGCSLSFGEHFNAESVSYTPINKLYIETDESNLPVSEIYKQIAGIKMCDPEELNAGKLLIEPILLKI